MDTYTQRSGWPIHEGRSQWTPDGMLTLHHDENSHRCGRRACFPDMMEAEPLHQDVIVVNDREGFMRSYMAKYSAKFSDSLITDLLTDAAPATHVAMGFLDRYHPAEPEMILQLFGARFRQWHLSTISGGKRDFLVPTPDNDPFPAEVQAYMRAEWACGQISLLDFLRKTNARGEILCWLREKHEQSGEDNTAEEFARAYTMKGEKVVAARTLSWYNDRYYGQWLMLHVPFTNPTDFALEEQLALIPNEFRFFAMALLCKHPIAQQTWHDPEAIHKQLKMEGNSSRYCTSVMQMCMANAELVHDYLSGRLNAQDELAHREAREATLREQFLAGSTTRQQAQIEKMFRTPAAVRREVRLPVYPVYEQQVLSGEKTVEGRINKGAAASITTGDIVALGRARCLVKSVNHFDNFTQMLHTVDYRRAMPGAASVHAAVREYHQIRNYATLAEEHGVVAFELDPVPETESIVDDSAFPWTPQQRACNARLDEFLQLAMDAAYDPDEERALAAGEKLAKENRIIVALGPPGSGKTTVQKRLLLRNHAMGGRGFYALPNNALSSRMQEQCGSIVQTGTCHSILGLDEPHMYWPSLQMWQLGLIDEISQLKDQHYAQLSRMFVAAERCLVLFLTGDKQQLSGFGESRMWHSTAWRNPAYTWKIEFPQMHRCKDKRLAQILMELRVNYPGEETLRTLREPRFRAWLPVGAPTPAGMQRLFGKHPNTQVLVITRRGTDAVNEAALHALFPRFPPRATIPADVESYSLNYEGGELKDVKHLVPSQLPVYRGMRVFITKTLRKDLDFVNGMQAKIVGWNPRTEAVRVQTTTGRTFDVTKWADPDLNHMQYYPLRVGYASTIFRMAGAELEHATIYLDVPHAAAAGYTAMSRVSSLENLKFGGHITADHFAPARG